MNSDRPLQQKTLVTLLAAIAPELEAEAMLPDQPLRQLVDLDSMDWLNFLVSINEHFGVTIPEADYARLVTLNDVLDYLQTKRV
jgi:acyl carrier protein